MTTEREMLEYAAKALGIELSYWCSTNNAFWCGEYWNPLTNSADCAAMCAKLLLDWIHSIDSVIVVSSECDYEVSISRFINDREAAWRYAATMVAAKIGGMK